MPTVVVVDDDADIRCFLTRALRFADYDVLAFSDAGPMLDEVDFDAVDLVLTDLHMPTSGDVAVRTLRDRGIDLPVIVLSGNLDFEMIDVLMGLGVEKILHKPVGLKVLLAAVAEVFGH